MPVVLVAVLELEEGSVICGLDVDPVVEEDVDMEEAMVSDEDWVDV